MPACFDLLRRRLEAEFEDGGTRRYIQVLRLLERASVGALSAAIERALNWAFRMPMACA